MTKQVRETAAGSAITAHIILNPKGVHVATVQSHYGNGGTLTLDIWTHGDDATRRTAEAMGFTFGDDEKTLFKGERVYSYRVAGLQQGRAGGGGYDKFTAALSGLFIDGYAMSNHCSQKGAPKPPRGRTTWPDGAKAPKGYSFSNYQTRDRNGDPLAPDSPAYGWMSCYRREGFKYLEEFGYRVIQAI